ncbi:MAG: hypothetical protein LBI19_10545 [Oscillospiraceae bacterium]|jgi:hypothetical protein|nr:hypothetical protein [Oscillospiraceae bacterium]
MIRNYADFIAALLEAGFSGAIGGKDDGVFALFRYGWGADAETGIEWHTGNPDTDPWEWRTRVLDERDDIAYGKVFSKKAGYITKEWYPYFLAARRGGKSFYDEYADGTASHFAKRIYDAVADNGSLPLDEIKRRAGFYRADKAKFDAALNELQMKLYLTMCGKETKLSQTGGEYGWSSTVFCTVETFWPPEVFAKAAEMDGDEAAEKIKERILALNPSAVEKKIQKFIGG